jgi:hypothetical protein
MTKDGRGHIRTEIVRAVDLLGRPVAVAVSLLDTQGGVQIALKVDDGIEVILPDHASINLSVHLQTAFADKLKGRR